MEKGDKFNYLTFLYATEERGHEGRKQGVFLCICGIVKNIVIRNVKDNSIKSCGCKKYRERKVKVGQKYGRLVVLEIIELREGVINKIKCLCDCGNITYPQSGKLTNMTTKSCGCLAREVSGKLLKSKTGDKHPCWKNYTEAEKELLRHRPHGQYFRKQVLKKFNFTCFVCNNKAIKLFAHHLDGYNWCVESRQDWENNGVCLCEICHKEFHSKYGQKDNTRQQFEEFMELKNVNCQL